MAWVESWEWNRNSQWERDKPAKIVPDDCEGQSNYEATANGMNYPFFRGMSSVPRVWGKVQRLNTQFDSVFRCFEDASPAA